MDQVTRKLCIEHVSLVLVDMPTSFSLNYPERVNFSSQPCFCRIFSLPVDRINNLWSKTSPEAWLFRCKVSLDSEVKTFIAPPPALFRHISHPGFKPLSGRQLWIRLSCGQIEWRTVPKRQFPRLFGLHSVMFDGLDEMTTHKRASGKSSSRLLQISE
jgi:hypothetical protein